MKTLYAPPEFYGRPTGLCAVFLLLLALAGSTPAQSTDIEFPTPIRAAEISGAIVARDVGDPRLTRYFYSFTGTPGDLILTVESRNLEGDVDVFTAGTLSPLAKISLYAGVGSSGGSKTVYLRTRQSLILRVEARTPNDNEGTFRVRFGGTFEPIGSDIPDPEPVIPTVSEAGKKGRRVTSSGARIDEPEPVTPAAEIQPETTTTPTTEPPAETTATTPEPVSPRPTVRTRRPRSPRTRRARPAPTARNTPAPAESAPQPAPLSGPRLIIETRDGMKVERYMTTVRRVTVERGQIVVVTTDGKVERQPMANVLRMAIEP